MIFPLYLGYKNNNMINIYVITHEKNTGKFKCKAKPYCYRYFIPRVTTSPGLTFSLSRGLSCVCPGPAHNTCTHSSVSVFSRPWQHQWVTDCGPVECKSASNKGKTLTHFPANLELNVEHICHIACS